MKRKKPKKDILEMPRDANGATMADRIKAILSSKGQNTGGADLARMMGLKNRQTPNRWLTGVGKYPTPEMIFGIADALNVSARWIAFGAPHMPTKPIFPTVEEAEVCEIFRALPPKARDLWLSQGRQLVQMSVPGTVNSPFAVK